MANGWRPSYRKTWRGLWRRGVVKLRHPIRATRSAKKFFRMRALKTKGPSIIDRPSYNILRRRLRKGR